VDQSSPTLQGEAQSSNPGHAYRRYALPDWPTEHELGAVDAETPMTMGDFGWYMLHAYENPIRVFDLDDLIMLIGGDESGRMIEVGVAAAEGIDFQAMQCAPARSF
jgi:hypothetical protein